MTKFVEVIEGDDTVTEPGIYHVSPDVNDHTITIDGSLNEDGNVLVFVGGYDGFSADGYTLESEDGAAVVKASDLGESDSSFELENGTEDLVIVAYDEGEGSWVLGPAAAYF